jgi:ATP synthase I chain
MTVADLVSRVTLHCLVALAALVAGAGWLAGLPGAAGAAAGGAIALLHFRWLARGAVGALRGEGGFTLGLTGLGLRSAGAFGALALTLAGGWAHPLAVLAGLSVLPPVLIAEGVRSAG